MLTVKQRDLLLYIHDRMSSGNGVSPAFEERRCALQLKSKSGIHRLISALEERGYIERLLHRARALKIIRLPESTNDIPSSSRSSLHEMSSDTALTSAVAAYAHIESIPLMGRIAAGTPIEAIRDEGNHIQIPPGFIGKGEHYALTVDGDSMINAGIHDQDTVVIKKCDTAENGAIIVALVDGEEVTLKRLRRAGQKIVLEPENELYEPRVLEPHRVKIQGRLVSLLRAYH